MKILSVLLLLLTGSHLSHGQKILTIDFDEIAQKTKDSGSSFYHKKLVSTFVEGNTLSIEELRCLYYGAALNDYTGQAPRIEQQRTAFDEHYKKEQFREALPPGLRVLDDDPINIRMNYNVLVCYHRLGIKDSAQLFARRYYGLLKAIQSSGDGTTVPTAFVVTRVPDEYDVLRTAGFRSVGQALLEPESGHTDKLTLDTVSQTQEPKIPALYFNVEMSFIAMRKLMESIELTLPEAPKTKK